MFDSLDKTPKVKLEVAIELEDGKCLTGSLFLTPQARLTDLLNDDRTFLPFEPTDGYFIALKKSSFRSVEPVNR